MNQPKTAEEQKNAVIIRELYASAEGAAKDTPKFVSFFGEGGYFYDVAAGKKYYGQEIGLTVDIYATAFPNMHRELYSLYFNDDVVVVENSKSLQEHLGPQTNAVSSSCWGQFALARRSPS